MLSMPVTHHAVARMQQRAVRPEIVDYLLDFGRCDPIIAKFHFYAASERRG
jgi:hypothetical protein